MTELFATYSAQTAYHPGWAVPLLPHNFDDDDWWEVNVRRDPLPATRTIQVSGHAPVVAKAIAINGNEIGMVAGSCHLNVLDGIRWSHCPRCNRAMKPGQDHGQSLGYPLCPTCDDTWRLQCLSVCGRLPGPGEFFCRGCASILDREAMCRPDADGRRRWRCKPCRAQQVADADRRRREKSLAGVTFHSQVSSPYALRRN